MFLRRGLTFTSSLRAATPLISSRSVTFLTPRHDIRYLINDVYNYPKEYQRMGYTEANEDMIETVINEVGRFAEEKLDKLRQVGDNVGAKYDPSTTDVTTPPGFKEAYAQYRDGGWQALAIPSEFGGMGMPDSLNLIKQEIIATSNWAWSMYPGLSVGCMNTLLHHGSADQKKAVLPHLASGIWTGTMCLTEPHCGTDLAQCKTRAVPTNETGLAGMKKYKLTGTKIFISCGEHDMSDNIIHIVLARLPDAPKGTKGISLFLVPKYDILDPEGSVDNSKKNVVCGGIEEKMGIHGSSTCVINFENSEGYLIGKEHEGLVQMFTFMNAARLGTALQGVTAAELSYQGSLPYAKERASMRSLSGTKRPEKDADPIIFHPDVRRMLLLQRAIAEGGRSMMYHLSLLADKAYNKSIPEAERKAADQILGLLTPIAKGFLTELGFEATNHGMQIYGGHGFIRQWGMEQLTRDARIATLYEGTTTIQSLDLLGRKILLDRGKTLFNYIGQLCKQTLSISSFDFMKLRYRTIRGNLKWQTITMRKMVQAAKNRDAVGSGSVDYLMFSGYVCLANYWLQMATISQQKLNDLAKSPNADEKEKAFHKSKIMTAQFYFDHVLPRADGLEASILADPTNLMSFKDDEFHFY